MRRSYRRNNVVSQIFLVSLVFISSFSYCSDKRNIKDNIGNNNVQTNNLVCNNNISNNAGYNINNLLLNHNNSSIEVLQYTKIK